MPSKTNMRKKSVSPHYLIEAERTFEVETVRELQKVLENARQGNIKALIVVDYSVEIRWGVIERAHERIKAWNIVIPGKEQSRFISKICQLTTLQGLIIRSGLRKLPSGIGNLKNLHILVLIGGKVTNLPPQIKNLSSISTS